MSDKSSASQNPLAPFASLVQRITIESIIALARRVRQKYTIPENPNCSVRPPTCGSYNLVYRLDFSDGVSWDLRIPRHTQDGHYVGRVERFIRSEATTMTFLRITTSIPIPEIFDYDDTTQNEIGAMHPTC